MVHRAQENAASKFDLLQLADLWGIEESFEDVTGKRRGASAEAMLAVLSVLGAPVRRSSDVSAALRERRQALWRRCLQPVTLAWDGGPTEVELRLPARLSSGPLTCSIDQEDGQTRRSSGQLENLPIVKEAETDGTTYVLRRLRIADRLPLGYHRLRLERNGQEHTSLLLAAPMRACTPKGRGWERSWGVFLPLHALRSERSWGAGDFSDLQMLREWAQRLGAGFVGTLPLLAAFLDEPFEISPYSPVSRLFWNEFYVDVREVPELTESAAARRLLESAEFHAEISAQRAAPLVDYRRQMQLKRPVLEELARTLLSATSPRREAFERYAAEHPRLADYAEFRAVGERLRKPWPQWPAELREGSIRQGDFDHAAKHYHMYVQWLAEEQLQRAAGGTERPGLYMDLPLGVHADGYDVWRERQLFAIGVAGGAPPDLVFPGGQNWGFVPFHPEAVCEQGYAYVREYVRHQLRFAKVLRIDHMPSFHRVYWIPPGRDPCDGAYVRYPAEELYAVFCLESHRHNTMLVGEDLGTVPPEVPQAMAQHNVHRMYVVQYELKPDPHAALPMPPAFSIAGVNTHDMPPFAGFWKGQDIDEREEAGLISDDDRGEEEQARANVREALQQFFQSQGLLGNEADVAAVFDACLAYLRDSPGRMLVVNLEDLWHETRSQNIPSTSGESPNWRRKARYAFEDFRQMPQVVRTLQAIHAATPARGA